MVATRKTESNPATLGLSSIVGCEPPGGEDGEGRGGGGFRAQNLGAERNGQPGGVERKSALLIGPTAFGPEKHGQAVGASGAVGQHAQKRRPSSLVEEVAVIGVLGEGVAEADGGKDLGNGRAAGLLGRFASDAPPARGALAGSFEEAFVDAGCFEASGKRAERW